MHSRCSPARAIARRGAGPEDLRLDTHSLIHEARLLGSTALFVFGPVLPMLLLIILLLVAVFLGACELAARIANLLGSGDASAALPIGLRQVGATLTFLLLSHCRKPFTKSAAGGVTTGNGASSWFHAEKTILHAFHPVDDTNTWPTCL
jgi:hypothetical protein